MQHYEFVMHQSFIKLRSKSLKNTIRVIKHEIDMNKIQKMLLKEKFDNQHYKQHS